MNSTQMRHERPVLLDVVERVADRTGTDVTELAPLARTVDPDLLDEFVETDAVRAETNLQFSYEGYEVTVHGDGRIAITEGGPPPDGGPG